MFLLTKYTEINKIKEGQIQLNLPFVFTASFQEICKTLHLVQALNSKIPE